MARKDTRRKQKQVPSSATAAGTTTPRGLHGAAAGGLAVLGIAILLVIFFNPIFFTGKSFAPPDEVASLSHRPFLEESFSSPGPILQKYPLWTPYIFSGMPSFASLTAAPYTNPMSFLLGWIPAAMKLVTYYFLLGLFTWWFLRRRGMGHLGAFFGAVTYVFCTHLVTMIMFGHNSKIATLVFLPLVVMATDEVWRRPGLRWASVLAAAVGTMLVTSHLQIAYYTLLAAGLYMIVVTVADLRRNITPGGAILRWGVWAVAIAVGLAASAIIFTSVREYAAHSIRGGDGGGLPYAYATNWSLHPLEMTTFFIPSFLGYGNETYWGWMPFTDFPHYMGIVPLFLAVLAVVLYPRRRLHVYLVALAVLSLLVAFGKHLPLLYNLMFEFLPYFDKFRVPSMITVLLQFSVAALAASAVDRLVRGLPDLDPRVAMRRFWIVSGVFAAIVVVLGGLISSGGLAGTITDRIVARTPAQGVSAAQLQGYASQVATRVADMNRGDFARVFFLLVIAVSLLRLRLRGKIPGGVMAVALAACTILDLWVVGAKPARYYDNESRGDAFATTPAVEFLEQDPEHFRILPLTGQGSVNNWFAYYKIPSIIGYHPAKLKIYQDILDDGGPVGFKKTLSQGNFNVLDMLGTKYFVADARTAQALEQLGKGQFHTVVRGEESVVRNFGALPKMWFVERTRIESDPEAHMRALANPAWDPSKEAILFEEVGPLDPPAGATWNITRYEPRELDAELTSPGNCLLVLSEIYYEPGWKAFLDDRPVEIHRADYVLRAIEVPPGKHTLRMRYDPTAFQRGAYTSVAAYALILLAFGASFLTERRRGPEKGSAATSGDAAAADA